MGNINSGALLLPVGNNNSTLVHQMVIYYRDERNRLRSFQDSLYTAREALAKQGLFYNAELQKLICPFCFYVTLSWRGGIFDDYDLARHREHAGVCPLQRGIACGNVTIQDEEREIWHRGGKRVVVSERIEPDQARFSDFATIDSRLRSFDGQVKKAGNPEAFAVQGFFLHQADGQPLGVTCYICGHHLPGLLEDLAMTTDPAGASSHHPNGCVNVSNTSVFLRVLQQPMTTRVNPATHQLNAAMPNFGNIEARKRSLRNSYTPRMKRLLAAAGFVGQGDKTTRCFQCGLCLDDWTSNMSPLTQHILWNPLCPHVREYKTPAYIIGQHA